MPPTISRTVGSGPDGGAAALLDPPPPAAWLEAPAAGEDDPAPDEADVPCWAVLLPAGVLDDPAAAPPLEHADNPRVSAPIAAIQATRLTMVPFLSLGGLRFR
jgi:hypothetical protein